MKKEYLPIGSVVLLKGAKQKLMITGFYIKAEGVDTIFDYSGCLYPEGIISSQENGVFNHDQIEQVFFRGYQDDEEIAFKNALYQAIEEEEKKANEPVQTPVAEQPQMASAPVAPEVAPVEETNVEPEQPPVFNFDETN